jgi:hypothetical protein
LRIGDARSMAGGLPHYLLLICLKGAGTIAGEVFSPGTAWMVPAGAGDFPISDTQSEWMVTYSAGQRANY